jgi:hypothetical protein
MIEIARRLPAVAWPCMLALGLALLTSACAGGTSSFASSDDLFDYYDGDGDGAITQTEWNQNHQNLDADGDGAVSRGEFNAAVGGGFGGGGRR